MMTEIDIAATQNKLSQELRRGILVLAALSQLREPRYGYALISSLAEQGLALFLEHRNRVYPYDDASPVLKVLSGRYRLVSLTNGNADVERTPLRGHFDKAFRAEDVGAGKPDPALFNAAVIEIV